MSRRDPPPERRTNFTLREMLEEFVGHARDVAARATKMTPEEMEQALERLEWLADEVWRIATTSQRPTE
jgi:DNA gyrase/topoisomerase IV subunit A